MIPILHRITDRARGELREWRRPSRPAFLQEELDHVLLEQIPWHADERVLDVGCAHGVYMNALKRLGARITGIDISLDSLPRARAAGHAVAAASGSSLPFADAAFDTLLCHKTMYLFNTPDRAIREFSRVLRPGGRIVFSGSNTRSPYARIQRLAIGLTANRNWAFGNRLSATDWIRAFTRHGLRARSVYSCNLVWPLVFRVFDRWLIPNEWMRRYSRGMRRLSRIPLRAERPHPLAQDFVVEIVKPGN
ncbi:MAG: methyltransferase domain-containing protein [Phycisphaerae bacterium]